MYHGDNMQTIKQGFYDGMCVVCCVAMATGSTVEEVYEFLNDGRVHGDPMCDADEAMFLLSRGWIRGGEFDLHMFDSFDESKELSFRLEGKPAIIDVESRTNPDVGHAIFWDGSCLRDPNPRMGETSEFSDYNFLRAIPLVKVPSSHYCKRMKLEPRPTPEFVLTCRDWYLQREREDEQSRR
jgi:hypothetical protein